MCYLIFISFSNPSSSSNPAQVTQTLNPAKIPNHTTTTTTTPTQPPDSNHHHHPPRFGGLRFPSTPLNSAPPELHLIPTQNRGGGECRCSFPLITHHLLSLTTPPTTAASF